MKNGFTLLELLIAIAIIGILSTMMVPNFVGAQEKAKEAATKSVLLGLQNALENYSLDAGTYPTNAEVSVADLSTLLVTGGYLARLFKNPFTGLAYRANDTAGKILYHYDTASGGYGLTAYKRDGATVLLETGN
jgi:type II secretion system protein G